MGAGCNQRARGAHPQARATSSLAPGAAPLDGTDQRPPMRQPREASPIDLALEVAVWVPTRHSGACYLRAMPKIEIDLVTAEFFGAFDNRGGKTADVARICRLVLPSGVIVKTGPEFTVYTVDEFIEPRQRLLTDGRLIEFSEWETSERTEIAGDIASRFCEYRKSGILDGEPFEGGGTKTIQFVRTSEGWRIAAVSWYDQP
jgi:SnoaL-like domain